MTPMHDLPEHQMIPVDANGNGPAVNVHHYECRCGNRACDRALVDLQGWKAEATTVLAAWEEVWVTAGQPGPLGGSKAAAVKAVIERLNAAAVAQDTAVDHLEAPAVTDLTPQQVIARQLRRSAASRWGTSGGAGSGSSDHRPDRTPADSGTLPDRLRQIADDLYGRTASTHSDACWQWHDTCALHRAAEQLDRLTVLGDQLADAVPVRAPNVASQPYRNGYQDCIQRTLPAVDAWKAR